MAYTSLSKHEYGWFDGQFANKGGGALVPDFRTLSNGSITPTIGTAGTFARNSNFLYPTATNALASITTGVPAVEAYTCGPTSDATTRGGVLLNNAIRNDCIRASTFNLWSVVGTGLATPNATIDPLGSTTADEVSGSAAGDGVQLDSGVVAASKEVSFSVWMISSRPEPQTVTITVQDQAGSPASTSLGCTTSDSWQQFKVSKIFAAGATGNIVLKIVVNDTASTNFYFYGAGLWNVLNATNALLVDFDMCPTIITTGATATLAVATLKYTGAELTPSTTKRTISVWFYVPTIGVEWSAGIVLQTEAAAFAIKQGIGMDSGKNLRVAYHAGTYVGTGDALSQGQWNHVVLAVDASAGDSETYLNGVSVHTDANTAAAYALANLYFANGFSDGTAPTLGWNAPIGRTEYYSGVRLTTTQAQALYAAQKGVYGL